MGSCFCFSVYMGAQKIQSMMEQIRTNVLEDIGGLKMLQFPDYIKDVLRDCVTGEVTVTGFPKSNVLYFELEDGAWYCIRQELSRRLNFTLVSRVAVKRMRP